MDALPGWSLSLPVWGQLRESTTMTPSSPPFFSRAYLPSCEHRLLRAPTLERDVKPIHSSKRAARRGGRRASQHCALLRRAFARTEGGDQSDVLVNVMRNLPGVPQNQGMEPEHVPPVILSLQPGPGPESSRGPMGIGSAPIQGDRFFLKLAPSDRVGSGSFAWRAGGTHCRGPSPPVALTPSSGARFARQPAAA